MARAGPQNQRQRIEFLFASPITIFTLCLVRFASSPSVCLYQQIRRRRANWPNASRCLGMFSQCPLLPDSLVVLLCLSYCLFSHHHLQTTNTHTHKLQTSHYKQLTAILTSEQLCDEERAKGAKQKTNMKTLWPLTIRNEWCKEGVNSLK